MKARVALEVAVEVFEEEEEELVREEEEEPSDFLSPTPSPTPSAMAMATRVTAEMMRVLVREDLKAISVNVGARTRGRGERKEGGKEER